MTNNPTEQINKDAEEFVGTLSVENLAQSKIQEIFDDEAEGKVRYIPTPNFTDCGTAGSQLPINVANETINILSRYRSEFDFVDFIKEKLNYSSRVAVCMAFFSEQIDALVLAIKQFESNKALILGDQAGLGKGRSQPLDAKILTPVGWKTMGDMRIGSQVITSDGTATKVIGVYPQGKIDVYKITFSDGTSTECSTDHLWNVKKGWQRDHIRKHPNSNHCGWVTLTTEEIKKSIQKRLEIPIVQPISFREQKVSIDPYLLGVLLGDACIRESGVELTNADSEILDYVSNVIDDKLSLKNTRKYHYQISKKSKNGWHTSNPLTLALRELNLTGKNAETKFIPDCYKFNSIDVRLSILQGLMDTDGYVSPDGACIYYTVSKQLADDVCFLVQSLGGTARRKIKHTKYKYKGESKIGKSCHVVTVQLPNQFKPFRLSRKLARVKERVKYFPQRMIRSVEKIGQKECQCIKVEHKSHLYVTDNCILTHNTCAGILRYAYQNNIIPVFITEKENLFSDIYRDILGIGGLGSNGGNVIDPKPFIMNPIKRKTMKREDGTGYRVTINNITDNNDNVLYEPISNDDINYLVQNYDEKSDFKGRLKFKKRNSEFNFNSVFLTYNVISKTKGVTGNAKKYFLRNISKNSIFIFDECHNASGKSKLGEWAKIYVNEAKGVLFSSATFAKNPQAFPLYIIKTAMREAQIDVTNIEDAIGVGGENVSEYISSVLVKEGQMIRRERDFSGCTMGAVYEGSDKQGEQLEEARDRIYNIFDEATDKFRAIYNYIRLRDFNNAINEAVARKAQELGLNLASQEEYQASKGASELAWQRQSEFINSNRDKWVIASTETNTLGATTKFHFTENILMAIKSKFTADAVIKELRSFNEHDYVDGKKRKSNRKPVIALRATGENLFDKLNLKSGDKIKNDFSIYIKAVVSGVMSGRVVFRKVNSDLFVPKYVLKEDDKEHIEEVALYEIYNEDLPDGGQRLNALLEQVNSYVSNIPLCPIDYLIDRIQSVQRKPEDRFGSVTPNFVVGEVTGRNYALYKEKNSDLWVYKPNERNFSVKGLFNSFNSGRTDVLIINSSGSTGGSIHSSVDFSDQRPRIMFIPQVELDVNTEVQKRGRINRSGQVSYPAYLYVLSQIPSELRKYLSLKKKLRKLDANVSANQTQNSNLVDIKDKRGESIEDIFNKYGEEAFKKFLDNDDNWKFRGIYDAMTKNWANVAYSEEEVSDSGEVIQAMLNPFTRELEIHPCDDQEEFYDKMNILYKSVVEEHKNNGTYQLELDIEDLKASLQSRVVRQMNNGATEFSKPLFMEDKYCLDRRKVWSKEKVEAEIVRMAKKFYKERSDEFVDLRKFHRDLLEDFEIEYNSFEETEMQVFSERKEPKRDEFMSDDDFNKQLEIYQEEMTRKAQSFEYEEAEIKAILNWFTPNRNVIMPDFLPKDAEASISWKDGKFIGYSFKNTDKRNKYSKGSIHLKFAVLPRLSDESSVAPTVEWSLGNRESLEMIKETRRQSEATFSSTTQYGNETYGVVASRKIDEWKVNLNARRLVRFLSGNILSGIQLANNMDELKGWCLVKYTNADGTVSTSLRLDYPVGEFIPMASEKNREINIPIQVSINNPSVIDYLKQTPPEYVFGVTVNTYRSKNVEPLSGAKELMVKNLIRIGKERNNINSVYVEIFQVATRKKKEVLPIPILNSSEVNNPLFFAPFLTNYTPKFNKIYTVLSKKDNNYENSGYVVENYSFSSANTDGYKRVSGFSKIYLFENIDTDSGAQALRVFLDQLYNEQELSLDFPQSINDYYNVSMQKDVYVPKTEKEKEKESVQIFSMGDYEYKLEVDYDKKYTASPPTFKEYVKGKNPFDKGIIVLGQPILPAFARAYNIYPINLSNDDTIKLFLSIFAPDEKEKFIREITERAEKGESSSKIGDFISVIAKKHSVSELKYIFGNRRTGDIGELLKTYALKGDITKLSYEVIEESPEEILKPRRKKTQITVEDAEKFVNYLLF